MKVFFLYLLILTNSEIETIKIPFGFNLIPITCEEAFNKSVIFKLPYTFYKNQLVVGHYCMDEQGKYWDGYEEKLDYELR